MHIIIGKSKVVSQLGATGTNIPCVIIEPVSSDECGAIGESGPERLNSGDVVDGGVVLEIHSAEGALVLIEDLAKAALLVRH